MMMMFEKKTTGLASCRGYCRELCMSLRQVSVLISLWRDIFAEVLFFFFHSYPCLSLWLPLLSFHQSKTVFSSRRPLFFLDVFAVSIFDVSTLCLSAICFQSVYLSFLLLLVDKTPSQELWIVSRFFSLSPLLSCRNLLLLPRASPPSPPISLSLSILFFS